LKIVPLTDTCNSDLVPIVIGCDGEEIPTTGSKNKKHKTKEKAKKHQKSKTAKATKPTKTAKTMKAKSGTKKGKASKTHHKKKQILYAKH